MAKALTALMLSLVLAGFANGQNSQEKVPSENELNIMLGRTLHMLEIISMEAELYARQEMLEQQELDESEAENGAQFLEMGLGPQNLEIVPAQVKQINKLSEEINDFINGMPAESTTANRVEGLEQLQVFETELNEKILVPMQARIIKGRVFARLLAERQGNYLETIQQCYPDKVELDEDQKEKLLEVGEHAKERKIEAAKEYRAALLEIAEESHSELEGILSHQEAEAFGEPATSWVPQ